MSLQVGAHIYARATVLVFIIVTTVLVSVFVSFFVAAPLEVTESSIWNATGHGTANYSGFRRRTLEGLFRLFDGASSCSRLHGGLHHRCHVQGRTRIMAGSNMSGQMFNRNTRLLSPAGLRSMLRFCKKLQREHMMEPGEPQLLHPQGHDGRRGYNAQDNLFGGSRRASLGPFLLSEMKE